MHAPWYNSYNYHYMEGETMRVMYEPWLVKYKVDVVFAGHVHAYERSVSIPSTILHSKLIFSFFKSPCIVMIALALLECASMQFSVFFCFSK